jgi:DNA polymerase-3 subunit beta
MLNGLAATLFATSADETKRILTGVHLTATSDRLEFAATDGHRLSVLQTGFLDADEPPVTGDTVTTNLEVTIPSRALRELERMLNQQTEGAIAVKFDSANMIFQSANQILISRLLDGSYPNYRQLIPNQFERKVTLERKLFLSALERIAVLADQKNNIVKITIDSTGQEISLSVEAPDVAAGRESLPAQVSGEAVEIAFNVKYLLDGLKALPSNEIQIQLNNPTSPAVLVPIGAAKMTYLLMPVQIRN